MSVRASSVKNVSILRMISVRNVNAARPSLVRNVSTIKMSSVRNVSTVRASSVRNVSESKFSQKRQYSKNDFGKKCQCSKSEFSKKCQYNKNEFGKKCQYNKNKYSKKYHTIWYVHHRLLSIRHFRKRPFLFSLTPRPPLKKCHIKKMTCFFVWIPKEQVSIWQRGPPVKTRDIEDDLILVFKNSRINDTPTVKVISVRLALRKVIIWVYCWHTNQLNSKMCFGGK